MTASVRHLGGPFDAAQDMLCAFARDIVFPISSSIQNFKYLWLAFNVGGNADPYVKDNNMSI
jgi:hypothetical protein